MSFSTAFRSATKVGTPPQSPLMSPTRSVKSARPFKSRNGVAARALSQDELKQQAAWKAVEYVQSGTAIGLGTGSTAAFAVARIGELLKEGKLKDIVAVPTSIKTYEQAKSELPLCFFQKTKPRLAGFSNPALQCSGLHCDESWSA